MEVLLLSVLFVWLNVGYFCGHSGLYGVYFVGAGKVYYLGGGGGGGLIVWFCGCGVLECFDVI